MRIIWCTAFFYALLLSGCSLLDVIVIEEKPEPAAAARAAERKRPIEPEKAFQKEKVPPKVQTASAKAVLEPKQVASKPRPLHHTQDVSSSTQVRTVIRAEADTNRVQQAAPRQFTADYDHGEAALKPVRPPSNRAAAEEKAGTAGAFKEWLRTGMQLYTWLQ